MSKVSFKEKTKKALVLSGGGARGSFEIGVWKALNELGFSPDIVTGISVGALNGALVVQGDIQAAVEMWKKIETGHILDHDFPLEISNFKDYQRSIGGFLIRAIRENGIGTEPLKDLIDQFLKDEEELRNKGVEFGVVVTNYKTGRQESYYVDELAEGQLKKVLLASASLFPAMEKTYINDIPYIDGGYRNHIPLDLAMERNPDEVVVVDLQPERNLQIKEKNSGKNIKVITSSWYLGDLLVFDQVRNEVNIDLGYNETMKTFGKYTGNLYTFEKNIGGEATDFYLTLNDLLEGNIMPDLHTYISNENNQHDLLNACSDKWGKALNDKNLPVALLEVTAKAFHISPGKVYTVGKLQREILSAVETFTEKEGSEFPEELFPEFVFGVEEWKEYIKNKTLPLSDRRIIKHILSLLDDKTADLSKLKYQLLFKLKPLPLVIALYIRYLSNKAKK